MRVIVCGDTHGNFRDLFQIEDMEPDLILQCGDFGYWPRAAVWQRLSLFFFMDMPVHWCDGNHEDHYALAALRGEAPTPRAHEIKENIIWQDRGSTLTLPDGRVVLFAGGAFSVDAATREEGKTLFSEAEILTDRDFARFPDTHVDIVISHTCPARLAPPVLGDMAQWEQPDPTRTTLDRVWDRYRPSLWFFGHWHVRKSGILDGCEWHALSALDTTGPLEEGYFLLES